MTSDWRTAMMLNDNMSRMQRRRAKRREAQQLRMELLALTGGEDTRPRRPKKDRRLYRRPYFSH